jgi:hypothetical protein
MTGIEEIGQVLELGHKKTLRITEEDKAVMGPELTAAVTESGEDIADILDAIYECLTVGKLHESLTSPRPAERAQVLSACWRCYLVLTQSGYTECQDLLIDSYIGLVRIGKLVRKFLFKRMCDPRTSDSDAEEIFTFLHEKMWAGEPGWGGEAYEAEAKRCGY